MLCGARLYGGIGGKPGRRQGLWWGKGMLGVLWWKRKLVAYSMIAAGKKGEVRRTPRCSCLGSESEQHFVPTVYHGTQSAN